jgi:alkylation response protein AidB-like acyl-CoA dehydrogenase
MQLPHCVTSVLAFPFTAANCSTAAYSFLTIAAGNMLRAVGTPTQHEKYLKPMLAGRFFGTMNLSETQAGSSLGDITTRAIKQPDGRYSIVGNKMWISGGDHSLSENIVHMVLAKVVNPDGSLPPGVKGISLFIVPKRRINDDGSLGQSNGVALAGLNHKMGYRGTTNCVMSFGQGEELCLGELLGKEGHGLNSMFLMMNEARIAIGYGASAQGYAGYSRSLDYARERRQGRSPLSRDPTAPQVPIIAHADVRRMLLAQKAAVEGSLSLCMYGSLLVDRLHDQTGLNISPKAAEDLTLLLDTLTPIMKSWPAEWCLEANKWALQIHGGYGYTRDYDVEQIYRDNRLNMIHEGTNGIQSLDLLGRKVGMKSGKGYRVLEAKMKESLQRGQEVIDSLQGKEVKELAGYQDRVKKLARAIETWKSVTELLLATGLQGAEGAERMLANSHEYLNLTGHVVIAWRWMEMETAALLALHDAASPRRSDGPAKEFYVSKCLTSRYFFDHELVKIYPQAELLSSLSDINLAMEDKYF